MAGFSRKKYLKLAKGFWGRAKNCFKIAVTKVDKSLQYAYIGRRLRPRKFRRQWIGTISAAVKDHGILYSRFANGLTYSNIGLDRKILADLAANQPYTFKAIVDQVKIQGNITTKRPLTTVEQMIKNNFLTMARLPAEMYKQKRKEDVKTEYIVDK